MIEAYPLHWPAHRKRTSPDDRERSVFGKTTKEFSNTNSEFSRKTKKPLTIAQALTRIKAELSKYTRVGHDYRVPPDSIIVSSNVPVRLDGMPYSGVKEPKDPGVAVYFKLDGKDYCLPCDKWNKVADNIAAIAAHVSAMRGIERWGVGESHDVYTGFKALPEKTEADAISWWSILHISPNANAFQIKQAYSHLAKVYHPDNPHTGNSEKFIQIKFAYEQALSTFNK